MLMKFSPRLRAWKIKTPKVLFDLYPKNPLASTLDGKVYFALVFALVSFSSLELALAFRSCAVPQFAFSFGVTISKLSKRLSLLSSFM